MLSEATLRFGDSADTDTVAPAKAVRNPPSTPPRPPFSVTNAHVVETAILPHLDAAYNLARWLVRDPLLAEDVVQDACVRAIEYAATFRGSNGRAWLLRIVRNAAYDQLRARQADVRRFLGEELGMDVADPSPGPEAAFDSSQTLEQRFTAVAALPIELRECLVLRELEELSYREIARITNVPIGTVMSRLWRARQLLTRPETEIL